jgi:hypothetical protein
MVGIRRNATLNKNQFLMHQPDAYFLLNQLGNFECAPTGGDVSREILTTKSGPAAANRDGNCGGH